MRFLDASKSPHAAILVPTTAKIETTTSPHGRIHSCVVEVLVPTYVVFHTLATYQISSLNCVPTLKIIGYTYVLDKPISVVIIENYVK